MEITKAYADQLKMMHSGVGTKIGFGVTPPNKLIETINEYKPKTILDYGCGSGNMMKAVKASCSFVEILGYDPGVDQYSQFPTKVDMIYSADVLEHIEPVNLVMSLKKLWGTADLHYHNIACHPAKKNLPEGRNCHLIVENPDWWLNMIKSTLDDTWQITYTNVYNTFKKKRQGTHFEIVMVKK